MKRPLTRDDKVVIVLVVATVVLINVPYGEYVLYPFKLFATWIHESFHGLAALLGMLNSCASNVTVVNIDNGFGAGYVASLINRL